MRSTRLGQLLFQEGAASINELPFPRHQEKGKGQVMNLLHKGR